ncbi:hypothetical protein CPLU01_12628 [Colletotrichum plurivorum]|uniref:Uncharacterized protein n=1 Tax=Colletotrichum plurivorum TaxID=2175906 RepID=A0A8H6N5B3_9PEZI|nr:hypothetical protein CPLU01_12628 [Colletotrichum plurivorum]
MAERNSRLAMVAVLLSFLVIFFSFEFAVKKSGIQKGMVKTFQQFFPFGFGILGMIIVSVLLASRNDRDCFQFTKIEADIGGPGIRISIWAQGVVLLAMSGIGTFHSKATGIKEIGAGLAITHLSLAIALLVEMNKGGPTEEASTEQNGTMSKDFRNLTAADAILGAMILDSQNVALSIPLVNKETLASRWQVLIMVLCQALGLVLTGVLARFFGQGDFPVELSHSKRSNETYETCDSLRVVWWGWLSNGKDKDAIPQMTVFWVYFAFRCLLFAQSSSHALYNTWIFHDAEKHHKALRRVTFPSLVEDLSFYERVRRRIKFKPSDNTEFKRYPTTVSLMYIVYGMVSWGSLAAAETALTSFGEQAEHDFSVGQVSAVVVASVTILRGLWFFSRMVLVDRDGIGCFC